jgi:hypothetical protein
MRIIQRIRDWARERRTVDGEDGRVHPLDSNLTAWGISTAVHCCILLLLAGLTIATGRIESPNLEARLVDAPIPQPFYFSDRPEESLGDRGVAQEVASLPSAPNLMDHHADVLHDVLMPLGEVSAPRINELPAAPRLQESLAVHGEAGVGTTGAIGAVDRITHEIMLSLEQRKTLVVWLFDQSGSLQRQREAIVNRFGHIYGELGAIQASGASQFAQHDDKPLLTVVAGFGAGVTMMTKEPTDDLAAIQAAVNDLPTDGSGREHVFSAVAAVATEFRSYRRAKSPRNVMIVLFTDEAGDDPQMLDAAIAACGAGEIPVYAVGVPAPFGREEAMIKYVDPDPRYDQSPQWAPVHQGPESLALERIPIRLPGADDREEPIASGFGPFGLSRLCYETGGIYFAVHPNQSLGRPIRRGEIEEFASYLEHFFDAEVMRAYRPDYVTAARYQQMLSENGAKMAIVQAAQVAAVTPMESVRLVFPKESDADLAADLTRAQQNAARLEPKILQVYAVLASGEKDRAKLSAPRWRANYDLAMGRTMAVKVRTESYNAMLALAKSGMAFENPGNDTWTLRPADSITTGSALEKQAATAREYLQRVVDEHPGTPWALIAKTELEQPLGWRWTEQYTGVSAPRDLPGNGGMRRGGRPNNVPARLPRRNPPPL